MRQLFLITPSYLLLLHNNRLASNIIGNRSDVIFIAATFFFLRILGSFNMNTSYNVHDSRLCYNSSENIVVTSNVNLHFINITNALVLLTYMTYCHSNWSIILISLFEFLVRESPLPGVPLWQCGLRAYPAIIQNTSGNIR